MLLDLMLPGMSGTEVCRAMRADAETEQIPVIMLTAATRSVAWWALRSALTTT